MTPDLGHGVNRSQPAEEEGDTSCGAEEEARQSEEMSWEATEFPPDERR